MNDLERLEQRVRELEAKLATTTTPSFGVNDLVLIQARVVYCYADGDYKVEVPDYSGTAMSYVIVDASQIRGRV